MARNPVLRRGLRDAAGWPALLVVLFAGAAAWFWLSYVPHERAAAVEACGRDLDLRADIRKEALERYFNDNFANAAALASYPTAFRAVAPEAAGLSGQPAFGAAERGHLQELFDEFARIQKVLGVVLWDAASRPVAKSRDLVLEDGCAGPAREVLASGNPEAGFHLHAGLGPVLTFAAPVAMAGGGTRGVAVVTIDPRRWVYPLLARPLAATTCEAVLVARDGEDLVYLSPMTHKPDAPLTFRRPLGGPCFAARTVLGGSDFVGPWIDYRGVRVVGAGRRLTVTPWALIVKVDEDEALADFRGRMRRTAVGGAAVLVAVFGVAWGVWQRRERLHLVAAAQSDTRIRQFNRLLKTISEIHEAIIRTEDRAALLSEACRVLVEHGGFRMAWVGLADREKGLVVPAARAGEASYYVDQITVRFDDTPEGRGPVGTAVRTGRHVVIPDLATEPTVAPWRERMLAHGFRTTGAFPFRVRGEVGGTLTVYSPEPGAIGDEETALLDELAADLGYAIETLEIRNEHKRAEEALRASQQKLRAFFDSGLIGMVFGDFQGHVLDANDEYLRVIGYTREELQAGEIRWDRLTAPEYVSRDEQGNAEVRERDACTPYEKQYIRKDGTRIWVLVGYVVLQPEREKSVAFILDISKQKRMEDEIRGSKERYRLLFDSNPHAMWVYDRESLRFLAVNDTAVAKYGYSREEFLSMTIADIRVPGERNRLLSTVRSVQGRVRRVGVWPQLRKDGSIVEAEITTHDLLFDGREARLVLAVDVTQRRRAESAIRRSRETMKELLDASPDSTLLVNPDGVVLACNKILAERFGKSITEIVGRPALDLLPPEIAQARRLRMEETVRTGKTVRFRDERAGRTFDNTIVPIDDGSGGVRQLAVFGRDVTDLVRAEAERAKSELYYRSLIENALDVTAVFSPEGVLLYVSPSVERALGYRPEELLGSSLFDMVHPEDQPEVARTSRRTLEDGTRVERFEYRVRHRDGSWRFVAAMGKSLPPETGMRGLILNARDTTERRQLQAQLLQAQKMEAVGRLAGGVAHDFNNLLTVIQGYGELLSTSLAGDETRREEVAEILNAAGRAAALTRQLLAFSRRQVLEMRVLDLGAVAREVEKMLRRLIGEDVDLVVVRPAGLSLIKADPGQIEQVLMNLAVNARDAMPKGGRLTVEVADLDLDAPLSSLDETVPPGGYVVVSVSDTGTGMDVETLARIFEPFFTTKEKGKGTGLGLSTVFGIVKQSDGYVLVESAPERGTTFRIFFPRIDGEGAAVAPVLRTEASPEGSETILLVEDEEPILALVRECLKEKGYTVLEATGAEEAMSLLAHYSGPLDLLLTDVVLKGDSGRMLADQLLALRPGVKVLYMSGYTDDVIAYHGILEPGLAFLQKPFTPAALARKVREALEGRPPREARPSGG